MTETNLNYTYLVDARNKSIVDEIISKDISILLIRTEPLLKPNWSIYCEIAQKTARIHTGKNINDKNAFTHELLHILEELNGHVPHEVLPQLIGMNTSGFRYIFNDYSVTHINNVILHVRMLPRYEKEGFKKNKFVYDFYNRPLIKKKLKNKLSLTHNGRISLNICIGFLLIYISHRFHPNKFIRRHYKYNYIYQYKISDPQFQLDIEDLCIKWENKAIFKNEHFFDNLILILDAWKNRNNYR